MMIHLILLKNKKCKAFTIKEIRFDVRVMLEAFSGKIQFLNLVLSQLAQEVEFTSFLTIA